MERSCMLSPSQLSAVTHKDGPCLTLAGPGSGKTTVLTKRIVHLITEEHIPPEQILVITFTKAAALEMKERFESIMQSSAPVCFGTFHSVFFRMMRQDKAFAAMNLLNGKQKLQILKEVAFACEVPLEEEDSLVVLEKEISYVKNTRVPLDEYQKTSAFEENFPKLFEHYHQRKQSYQYLDFDDMLSEMLRFLQENQAFAKRWQQHFAYIFIDEVQDMNQLQFDAIRILAEPQNNLFVVGDDDQSIYGFRGADPGLMLDFPNVYPDCKQILLGDNYRSQPEIVRAACNLISKNKSRFDKDIQAKKEGQGHINIISYSNDLEEAKGICELLRTEHAAGVSYEEMAILFRNHVLAQNVIERMRQEEIPLYFKENMPNVYQHEVVLDLISYLRLTEEPMNRKDVLRVMNRPNRYMSRSSVHKERLTFSEWGAFYDKQLWLKERIIQLEKEIAFMKRLSATGAISYIRRKLGYDEYLKERAKNEEELAAFMEAVNVLVQMATEVKGIRSLLKKWEQANLFMEKLVENTAKTERKGVGLFTMHGSKGLEFDNVVILDCNEQVVPSSRAQTPEQIEEERRLFYVAMTRARNKLFLSTIQGQNGQAMSPSRFLKEIK